MNIISIENFNDHDVKIKLEWSHYFFWKRRGSVVGNATVWHWFPSGNRCSTFLESWLCDRWTAWKWQNK